MNPPNLADAPRNPIVVYLINIIKRPLRVKLSVSVLFSNIQRGYDEIEGFTKT